MSISLSPPTPKPRPVLARWAWERNLTNPQGGTLFGVSHETFRRWCLPFGDLGRKEPSPEERVRIAQVTAGEVSPESFDPPSANADAATALESVS